MLERAVHSCAPALLMCFFMWSVSWCFEPSQPQGITSGLSSCDTHVNVGDDDVDVSLSLPSTSYAQKRHTELLCSDSAVVVFVSFCLFLFCFQVVKMLILMVTVFGGLPCWLLRLLSVCFCLKVDILFIFFSGEDVDPHVTMFGVCYAGCSGYCQFVLVLKLICH